MRIFNCILLSVISTMLLFSCQTNRQIVRYELEDGIYRSNIFEGKNETVFIDNEPDFVYVYPVKKTNGYLNLDTLNRGFLSYPQKRAAAKIAPEVFKTNNFDLDLITIPFKFRPSIAGVPAQLNTNLNALIYTGYRSDWYTLGYDQNMFGSFDRYSNHYGLTVGFFSGFGSTFIGPWFTRDQVQIEYDGIVWSNGVAVSFAFNYLTIGLGLGWDKLLDTNNSVWIYQNKPWLGLVLGINLN